MLVVIKGKILAATVSLCVHILLTNHVFLWLIGSCESAGEWLLYFWYIPKPTRFKILLKRTPDILKRTLFLWQIQVKYSLDKTLLGACRGLCDGNDPDLSHFVVSASR